jgi:hypothetical protein
MSRPNTIRGSRFAITAFFAAIRVPSSSFTPVAPLAPVSILATGDFSLISPPFALMSPAIARMMTSAPHAPMTMPKAWFPIDSR